VSIAKNRIGVAIDHSDTIIQLKLSKHCSIFMAESKAIEYIITSPIYDIYITALSDSLNALICIQNTS